ncbi:MAG: hypothetical protein ACI8ZX_001815 [Planctomycetota bacterium]|jgi:hypothetical protein
MFSLNSFSQNEEIQKGSSTQSKVINSSTLNQVMLYPEQKMTFTKPNFDNNYSYQTNNYKSLKTMKIIGSTLKSLVQASDLNIHYEEQIVSTIITQ